MIIRRIHKRLQIKIMSQNDSNKNLQFKHVTIHNISTFIKIILLDTPPMMALCV